MTLMPRSDAIQRNRALLFSMRPRFIILDDLVRRGYARLTRSWIPVWTTPTPCCCYLSTQQTAPGPTQ